MIQELLEEPVQLRAVIVVPIIHVLASMVSVAQPMVEAIAQPLHQASALLEQPVPSQTLEVSGVGLVLDQGVVPMIPVGLL